MFSRRSFLGTSSGALAASFLQQGGTPTGNAAPSIPTDLDHIIVGCSSLEDGIARLSQLSGYQAAPSGSHPGRGTRNAILGLSHNSYLELLAPDPAQPALLWHQEISSLTELTIVGWAVRHPQLDQLVPLLRERGVPCSDPTAGSRVRPDGQTLRWQTVMLINDQKGNLPFFIDWDSTSPHPSVDAPGGCLLQEFLSTGPLPEIPPPQSGMRLRLVSGKQSQLRARIAGLNGVFELTSFPVPSANWVLPGSSVL